MEKVYHETQKFRHWLLWVVLFLMLVGACYGIYQQMVLDIPFGQNPTSDTGLVLIAVIVVALNLMFWFIRLKTKIDDNGIEFSFYPFIKRKYAWSEIEKAALVNYGFVGGWGIRPWTRYGTVYNTRGQEGLAIELKNGKKFLIGTQNQAELLNYLQENLPNR